MWLQAVVQGKCSRTKMKLDQTNNGFKFFFISQVFYPDETSTASLFTDLAVKIAENPRIEVEVWCAQPSYSTREKQKSKVSYKNVSICYMPGTNFPKGNIVGRLFNYTTFSVSLFLKLLFSKEKTPVFTVTNPPFLSILASFIGLLKKRPYIYIVLDIYPDGLFRLGLIKENSLLVKMWKRFNRIVLRNAEKILVLGRDMTDWVKQTEPLAEKKTVYVPHWQNEELVSPCEYKNNYFVKKNNLADKFVVQYSGNMGLWNDMKTLAEAAKALEDNEITFCFIGDGRRRKELLEAWNNKPPANTYLFPFQPKHTIGESLTACHVALISLRENLEGIAVPCKLYGIMAAGIAIIAQVPQKSEIALAVQEEQCGIVVNPNDTKSLIKAIKYLKENKDVRLKMGYNARRAFEEKYTTQKIANKYIEIIGAENSG